MIQIAFQNKREDLKALAEYMAGQTDQGKSIGRQAYSLILTSDIAMSSLLAFVLLLGFGSQNAFIAILILVGLFLLSTFILLLRSKFRPRYYLAMQSYLAADRKFTAKDWERLQMPRKLTADEEWIEINSPISFRRCSWTCVEKIGITDNFVFIHVSGCPVYYVPKRDFPSEEAFKDFGQALNKLWKDHESRSVVAAA